MKKKIKVAPVEHEEKLIGAVLEFYKQNPGYRISQGEFVGLVCAISQQMLSDI